VAILWNPDNASVVLKFKETEAAARVLGLQLQSLEARHPSDIERGFQAAARGRADAVVTADEQFLSSQRARIVALAIRQRLPVASEFRSSLRPVAFLAMVRVLPTRPGAPPLTWTKF
jgi:putative tryptophan/tyrosine transport system substrate-binding protein